MNTQLETVQNLPTCLSHIDFIQQFDIALISGRGIKISVLVQGGVGVGGNFKNIGKHIYFSNK